MKRISVMLLALLLAIPAVSFAGTVDSRWDVTIGGYIKFDMGYADQSQGADYTTAARESFNGRQNQVDEYGNFYTAAGETRLNFLVKGPDGWGAKITGFMEGDFRGTTAGSTYGVFQLRHAYMRMQWANDTLTIGHTWQKWGYVANYSTIFLGVNMRLAFDRGSRQPQIMWEHRFTKNWILALGAISPTNSLGTAGGATRVDSFSLSKYPFGEGEFSFTSDSLGKIGPMQLAVGLGGFYGKDRQVFGTNATTVRRVGLGPCIGDGTGGCVPTDLVVAVPASRFSDKLNDAWGLAFKGYIPIIPEKKSNKGGALALSVALYATQNPSWYEGSTFALGAYNRGTSGNPAYAVPLMTGGWSQATYYFTNNVFTTVMYGQLQQKLSQRYMTRINPDAVQAEQQFLVNVSYDVNPAVRLGIEYDYIKTRYAWFNNGFDRNGKLNSVRIGAWYLF
jgi:hypothetical protein